jgi:hypothetical protein
VANPVKCTLCNATLSRPGSIESATIQVAHDRFACRSCLEALDRDILDGLFSAKPTPPPIVGPSASSAAIMRALGERFAITLTMQAGVVAAAAERIVEALRSGRWDLYLSSGTDLFAGLREIRDAMNQAEDAYRAIRSLDPSYFEAVDPIRRALVIAEERKELKNHDRLTLALEYVRHRAGCSTRGCELEAAFREEFKARGMEVPPL